jgi:hypothetical protein
MKSVKASLLFLLLFACSRPGLHDRFMDECMCFVYENDVVRESLGDYTVEFIDQRTAGDCPLVQLKNVYLLNVSENYAITVAPQHPEKNRELIAHFQHLYHSPDVRLHGFVRNNNRITLTLEKITGNAKGKGGELIPDYTEWKHIYLSRKITAG